MVPDKSNRLPCSVSVGEQDSTGRGYLCVCQCNHTTMTKKIPTSVYAEMTPNPSTMKFVANKYLLITGDSAEFSSKSAAKGYSPMAEELFNFPFVKNVFIAANFVTITKTDNVPWDFITMELRVIII